MSLVGAKTTLAGTDGREIQMRVDSGYVQYKYDTDTEWTTFFLISDYIPYVKYTINFNESETDWGFVSKHAGNITTVQTTNISSYTIDKLAVTLPKAVVLDDTYTVQIVKTAPGTAQIVFNVKLEVFSEISTINFTQGDGKKTYGLSNSSKCVYKVNNELLTLANSSGLGTWTVDPLETTIALPTLPTGGQWDRLIYVRSGKMLVMGSNPVNSANKYFCYINPDDSVESLTGVLNSYSNLVSGSYTKDRIYVSFYDYLNDYVYINDTVYEATNLKRLDLNTNLLYAQTAVFSFRTDYAKEKVVFNPYRNSFIDLGDVQITPSGEKYLTFINRNAQSTKRWYNRKTKRYYDASYNSLSELDQYNNQIAILTASGVTSLGMTYNYSVDYDNNIAVVCSANAFGVFRLGSMNYGRFAIQSPDSVTSAITNGMYAYGNLHVLSVGTGRIYTPYTKLQCIDVSYPFLANPNFNYYTFPSTVVDIYTNRLL